MEAEDQKVWTGRAAGGRMLMVPWHSRWHRYTHSCAVPPTSHGATTLGGSSGVSANSGGFGEQDFFSINSVDRDLVCMLVQPHKDVKAVLANWEPWFKTGGTRRGTKAVVVAPWRPLDHEGH